MRVYGAWISTYYVLCTKSYDTFKGLFWSPAGSRQDTRSACILWGSLMVLKCVPPSFRGTPLTELRFNYLPSRFLDMCSISVLNLNSVNNHTPACRPCSLKSILDNTVPLFIRMRKSLSIKFGILASLYLRRYGLLYCSFILISDIALYVP